MAAIASYVFFDIETTGLPHQERNQTKITELCFVAVLRRDLEVAKFGSIPPVSKLSIMFNPNKDIHPRVTEITGLSNRMLQNSPLFVEKVNSIKHFIQELPKPVSLVAHNGNLFDFRILLAECCDAGVSLPNDLLCLDTLVGFRKLLKGSSTCYNTLSTTNNDKINFHNILDDINKDLITDDEDDEMWPDLNVSKEEWEEINEICSSISDLSCEEDAKDKQTFQNIKKKKSEKPMPNKKPKISKESYKLCDLYKRLLNKVELNTHRAEVDCIMLLECVVAVKEDFITWADNNHKQLQEIQPLIRNKSTK